jgi:hypothetical protein
MAGMAVKAALGRLTPPLLMGSTAEPEATPEWVEPGAPAISGAMTAGMEPAEKVARQPLMVAIKAKTERTELKMNSGDDPLPLSQAGHPFYLPF